MSSIFVSGIVGTGDYAVPDDDTELSAAESGLTTLLSGVVGLSFSDIIAFVVTAGGASPSRTLGAFISDAEYVAEVCPDPAETTTMTAAIEAALLADPDISAVGGQDVKLNIVPTSPGLWQRDDTEGVLYPNTVTDDLVLGAAVMSGMERLRVVGTARIDTNGKLLIADSATIPPLNVTERSAAPSSPSAGDIYLDDGTNTASGSPGWRRYTGAVWEDVGATGGGGASPFEVDAPNDEIQPIAGELTRGFVVGSQDMDDSGAANDIRMFFDKAGSAGAFRAGEVNGAEWDAASRGAHSVAFGLNTTASGARSFAWGYYSVASGDHSEAGGDYTVASGSRSHAEGYYTQATNRACHAEGYGSVTTGGDYGSHAEGNYTTASGTGSHAEGTATESSGQYSHAEGSGSVSSGNNSHAEGINTESAGYSSHAAGSESVARLDYSRATAGNSFAAFGDGQNIEVNCGTTTLDATPKELSLAYNLALSNIAMQTASVWGFTARVVGKSSEADGNVIFAIFEGLMRYDGTNVTLIGDASPLAPRVQKNTAGAGAWNVEIQNHAADNDFLIVVTGAAALTVRWVAQIQATELIVA